MNNSNHFRKIFHLYISFCKKIKMRRAVKLMENDYEIDPELTVFTDLDGEEFF